MRVWCTSHAREHHVAFGDTIDDIGIVTVNIALTRSFLVTFGLITNELTDDDFVLKGFCLLVAYMITDVIYACEEHSAHEEHSKEQLWLIEQSEHEDDTDHEAEEDETFMVNRDISEGSERVHLFFLIQ